MKRRITGIVPTFNEERNIRDCLESLKWVDELLIVDSFSTDGTLDIAREYTDRIIQRDYEYSASQKNWAIPQAEHEWILLLDSDERCTPELQKEIEAILNAEEEPAHTAWWTYRRNHFLGKPIKYVFSNAMIIGMKISRCMPKFSPRRISAV
ncbi:glycosyltransferase family 2 protein [Planctomycetota bacterium]